jgi:hypothetical protein
MNIENDFLTDFDLFGKLPELYYKGKSKKSSILGIVLTVIYIVLYIAFLIYKLVRMFKRVDLTFYDSYTFKGLPSIKLTNNEFYGGFAMGGMVDKKMYYLTVDYVSKVKVNGVWQDTVKRLDTEVCKLEWFGSEYQEIFADQPLHKYYCIKDVSGMVLEGYSNLERFSYFHVKFYPCVGTTDEGEECHPYDLRKKFFTQNIVELKFQNNELNPEDYKTPVIRRELDMNSPVFLGLYQLVYSYIQIVNIETDEDITGLNFFTDTIRKEQYTKYENSFIIASPKIEYDMLSIPGIPVAEFTLQLAAKVLTQKRQYTQLIDVLGDVGGLMEILYTVLNIISSLITEVLYDRSLVNSLFSFDLNKKYVVFNHAKSKIKSTNDEDHEVKDIQKLENKNNIEIYAKENLGEQNIIPKTKVSSTRKKVVKKKKSQRSGATRFSKTSNILLKEQISPNDNAPSNDNKLSIEENKIVNNISSFNNIHLGSDSDTVQTSEKDLTNVYINDWLICCFWCSSRKKNINKILFKEGSRIITQRLDILSMFNHFYLIEIMQKKLGIEAKGMNMSDKCKDYLHIYNMNNNYKTISN